MNARASDKGPVVLAMDAVGQLLAQTRQAKCAKLGREHATGALTGSHRRVRVRESGARFDHHFLPNQQFQSDLLLRIRHRPCREAHAVFVPDCNLMLTHTFRNDLPCSLFVMHRQAEAREAVAALGSLGSPLRGMEYRQQQCYENAYDGEHDQEFNQRTPQWLYRPKIFSHRMYTLLQTKSVHAFASSTRQK